MGMRVVAAPVGAAVVAVAVVAERVGETWEVARAEGEAVVGVCIGGAWGGV